MDVHTTTKWGEWVKARTRRVGFVRQIDLAAEIGCSEDQLSRWLALETPPPLMRKGFDRRLAMALRIDGRTLFTEWPTTSPVDAPLTSDSTAIDPDETTLRRKVLAIVELLEAPQLGVLHDKGRELLAAGMKQKAAA